jgi:hypothetical protein
MPMACPVCFEGRCSCMRDYYGRNRKEGKAMSYLTASDVVDLGTALEQLSTLEADWGVKVVRASFETSEGHTFDVIHARSNPEMELVVEVT